MTGHYPANTARVRWRFWIVTVAAVAALVLTASLGRWQLGRAADKQALQAAIEERAARAPATGDELLRAARAGGDLQQLLHRRVQLRGQWAPEATVFLDNRQMHGRPGFHVLTPLLLAGAPPAAVLVQRGWVPRDFRDRTRLPDVPTPAGEVLVQGRMAAGPARLYEFAPAAGEQGDSRIRQNLDVAAFAEQTGLPLLALSVLQTGAAADGLQRDWPAADNGVDKHYGYAFQWFGLCALVAILYVWFQILRPLRARQS
ncbi:SURF1 family protein [Melaminivora sp.]|uniref:SURF1 family protein n=1 Tax=Melaminivora sp. TaxID=1933032 RepID=UPI0028ADC99A|nr:SURF1 family protein [Melaminivora sp.]